MTKFCVICGGDDASGETLLEAPCQRHWVCTDDVASFFERATENESLYPPKCCGQHFLLDVYEAHVPFEVAWAFQMKAQGEYSVLAKYRVYCANPACSEFLSPDTHVKDPSTNNSYAICQDDSCRKLTCTTCKTLMHGDGSHVCGQNEDYKKFRQTATEKGFQECPSCASTVELAEACNHITCECGAQFCYICGEEWQGTHGCPHYGPAVHDEEGYNQDGFHRSTGLNREGRTRREQSGIDHGDDGDSEDEDDRDEDEDPDEFHPVLQHVEPEVREAFAAISDNERDMFLINLQIQLFEERGITFADDEDGDGESDDDGEEDDGRSDNNSEAGHDAGDEAQGGIPIPVGVDQAEDGVVRNDNSEEQNGLVGDNMRQDAFGEVSNADFAEALRLMEEFAGPAPEPATMQSDDNHTTPNVAATAPAVGDSEGPAAFENSVAQYLTQLSRAFTENSAGSADVANITAVDRPMSGAELTHSLQRMQIDMHLETVARVVIFEALKILHLRFPENDEITRVGLTLSDLIDKDQESSSAVGSDEQQPSTPMDVDLVAKGGDEEREPWMGPPGGWPDDEEL